MSLTRRSFLRCVSGAVATVAVIPASLLHAIAEMGAPAPVVAPILLRPMPEGLTSGIAIARRYAVAQDAYIAELRKAQRAMRQKLAQHIPETYDDVVELPS